MSRTEELIEAILNGETVDFEPLSRAEAYLINCVNHSGVEGLPKPISRLDGLLYRLAEDMAGALSKDEFIAFLEGTTTKIIIPKGTKELRGYGLYQLSSVTEIIFPEGFETVNLRACFSATRLENLIFPSSLKSLKAYSFGGCSSLSEVIFKGTPDEITVTAFSTCPLLTSIKVPWSEGAVANAPWGATNATITYNYTGE